MTTPPRATTQISLYHGKHLVTRGAGVPIEQCSYDEQVAVWLVDLFLESARHASVYDSTTRK